MNGEEQMNILGSDGRHINTIVTKDAFNALAYFPNRRKLGKCKITKFYELQTKVGEFEVGGNRFMIPLFFWTMCVDDEGHVDFVEFADILMFEPQEILLFNPLTRDAKKQEITCTNLYENITWFYPPVTSDMFIFTPVRNMYILVTPTKPRVENELVAQDVIEAEHE